MAKRRTNTEPVCSDEAALRAAIIQHPDEDTPRLAYADLLDEIGGDSNQARAEFIRLQIRLEASRPDASRPDYQSEVRAADLLASHGGEWVGGISGRDVTCLRFSRGFVSSVGTSAAKFIRHGGSWCARHPLQRVLFNAVRGWHRRLAASPHLDAIRHVSFHGGVRDELLSALGEAPRPTGRGRFPNLEVVEFYLGDGDLPIGLPGLTALAGWDLPRLRGLGLHGVEVGGPAAAVLTSAPWFSELKSLTLIMCQIGDARLAALLAPPIRQKLAALDLSNCRVTARGVHALADVPGGSPLEELRLEGNPIRSIDPDRLGEVFQAHPRLRLNLEWCPIRQNVRRELVRRFGDRVDVGTLEYDEQYRELMGEREAIAEWWNSAYYSIEVAMAEA
jgi:uncharacterized protein (TIGR02996 family)